MTTIKKLLIDLTNIASLIGNLKEPETKYEHAPIYKYSLKDIQKIYDTVSFITNITVKENITEI